MSGGPPAVRMVDLYDVPYWAAVGVALAVLVPLKAAAPRKWVLAGVNLGFVALLVGDAAITVLGGVAVAHLLLKQVERRRPVPWLVGLGVLGTLGLFLVHKLPRAGLVPGSAGVNPILAAIGFSYVALRMLDALRAVGEGRQPAPDLPATANYLLPFHALAAGPIQPFEEFMAQPAVPGALGAPEALDGMDRIAAGLFKKFVLANFIDRLFLSGFRAGGPYFLLEVQLHYLWLYLDFSAYSDVAAGVGRLIGVATPENFDRPYLARNLTVFWERWHISLSRFIRSHLFIPINLFLVRRTGGRRPLLMASVALAVAFLACGLWHEISLRYLLWGGIHAAGLIACNVYRAALLRRLGRRGVERYLANPWIRCVSWALTFEFVAASLVVVARGPEDFF